DLRSIPSVVPVSRGSSSLAVRRDFSGRRMASFISLRLRSCDARLGQRAFGPGFAHRTLIGERGAVVARAQHDLAWNAFDDERVAAHGIIDRAFFALVIPDQDRRDRRAGGPGDESGVAVRVDLP